MPTYRVEAIFRHTPTGDDAEDYLEEQLRDFMNRNSMSVQGGPVVFRIYPNGDPGSPWCNSG